MDGFEFLGTNQSTAQDAPEIPDAQPTASETKETGEPPVLPFEI